MKNLEDILAEPPDLNPTMKADWDRQKLTAEEVARRFMDGKRIILVADEVGMGKTYVALAAMAQHIFQTAKNDRKVLLVVPTSSVLSAKWEQEILTFNETYLPKADGRKQLRPLMIKDYWELVQNLHDYDNYGIERIREDKIKYFACLFRDWYNDNIRKPYKPKKQWNACDGVEVWTPSFLDFCSFVSPKIVEIFLSEWSARNPEQCDSLVRDLDGKNASPEKLKELLRDFSKQQDLYEPNVFIIKMGMLQRQSRKDNFNMQLLCTYIVGRLMRGLWSEGKSQGYTQLESCERLARIHRIRRKNTEWADELARTNLWGLRAVTDTVIGEPQGNYRECFFNNDAKANKNLLLTLKDKILRLKLDESGINLAVVDEVHNWKSGFSNGAREFRKNYAPIIKNKLIMSATPFQIHENELATVFSVAAGEEEASCNAQHGANGESMHIVAGLMFEGGPAKQSLAASNAFSEAWNALPEDQAGILSAALTNSPNVADALETLKDDALTTPLLRRFCKTALEYRETLDSFEAELKKIAIRHTKDKTIRRFHNGKDFTIQGEPVATTPRTVLYAASGYGDGGGALLDFIGMRAQQRLKKALGENGSVRLLGGINSSYEAFQDSWSGQTLEKLSHDPDARAYTDFFASLLDNTEHPKVRVTVERAVHNYLQGRKTLIFCERLKTQEAIETRIRKKLEAHIVRHLGRAEILRDFETVEYYLSRSLGKMLKEPLSLNANQEAEVLSCLKDSLDLLEAEVNARQRAKLVDLCLVSVLFPGKSDDALALYTGILDDVSALKVYLRIKQKGNPEDAPLVIEEDDETDNLTTRQQGNDDLTPAELQKLIKTILTGRNIWHPFDPATDMHKHILSLLRSEAQQLTGADDAHKAAPSVLAKLLLDIPQGLRSVLLRLDRLSGIKPGDSDLGTVIVEHLRKSVSATISPWDDTEEFVRLLGEAKGSIRQGTQSSRRSSLWRGVFLKGDKIVQSLNGSTPSETRVNLCAAFNSPLLPDILICTSVGSEGIDLHMQCAEVIHHDLPWNPAKLEQRTGRVDRVGSLAERLQAHGRINIGIPFLACNYDEFQYNTVWSRAQKQEVLLGEPDYETNEEKPGQHPDSPETVIELPADEDSLPKNHASRLPEALLNFLKVNLALSKVLSSSSNRLMKTDR